MQNPFQNAPQAVSNALACMPRTALTDTQSVDAAVMRAPCLSTGEFSPIPYFTDNPRVGFPSPADFTDDVRNTSEIVKEIVIGDNELEMLEDYRHFWG